MDEIRCLVLKSRRFKLYKKNFPKQILRKYFNDSFGNSSHKIRK